MKHIVDYKQDGDKYLLVINDVFIQTPIKNEEEVDTLCKDILDFLNQFDDNYEYIIDAKLSNEEESLGVIIDLWKDIKEDDEPFGVASFMFDEYEF